MEISEYQAYANQFSDYPKELGPFYLIYDLMSETGNLSDKLKEILGENNSQLTDKDRYKIAISLGDIFKTLCDFSKEIDISTDEILALNMKKLLLIREHQKQEEEFRKT